ncbi:MAG: hypothetical protein ACC646_11070 [Paracoccaceae bacterium]
MGILTNAVRVSALAALTAGLTLAGASGVMADPNTGKMSASASGLALWQFPDRRALNPDIFGTPADPLNIDLLPLEERLTNEAGDAYTTIKSPLMFSNNVKQTTGEFKLSVVDASARDGMNSADTATMEASFIGPKGREFKVVLKKLIPVGPVHPFFGGVGTNVLMHGATGIGTPLVAEVFSYITLWGIADVSIDGELVDSGRIVHVMVSERTRDDDFKLGFGVAQPDKLEIHMILPPLKGSPTGPVASPLPTGVILPNGVEQPALHVNFYGNAHVDGNQFVSSN